MLNTRQKSNLKTLRNFLIENQEELTSKFNMRDFFREGYKTKGLNEVQEHNVCGTAMCLIGTCSVIPEFKSIFNKANSWRNFSFKLFGVDDKIHGVCVGAYLFSSYWEETDNTIQGAITRINNTLKAKTSEDYERLLKDYHSGTITERF